MNEKVLHRSLRKILPAERVLTRLVDRYAYASDASFYYKVPLAIVRPTRLEEIGSLFSLANEWRVPLVFRAAGTSLSGQSVTDGILVDIGRNWNGAEALHEGQVVRVQPGIIGNHVNRLLLPYKRKIGPDPASINAAMLGGILANNSSGMCCGVKHNAYHTLKSIHFMLPDGNAFDTGNEADRDRFMAIEPATASGLAELRDRLRNNHSLVGKIRHKYRIKNTVGYSLNAFLDYDHPLDMLGHLLIGSEGTLAFIAEAKLETLPDHPCKLTGLLFFRDPHAACDAVPGLIHTQPEALELMDRMALRSVEHSADAPGFLKDLPDHSTAILCEYQEPTYALLDHKFSSARQVLDQLPLVLPHAFTRDRDEQAKLWKIRKGLYPSVAAVRASGTTVLLEDIAVPVAKLGETVKQIQALFGRYHFPDAIIFGHAMEGNLHFALSQAFNTQEEAMLFDSFSRELATLVIGHDGSLKAEHGTGRQIAPFVKDEWGEDAYRIMTDLKDLLDPNHILNPDVIISADPHVHTRDLKTMPEVHPEVDRCIECGYCEDYCPSRNYTLSPRQRIVVQRAMKRMEVNGKAKMKRTLERQFRFAGLDTCSVDGLCALGCPVEINTGSLVKLLRQQSHNPVSNQLASLIARKFRATERSVRFLLRAGSRINRWFGSKSMIHLTRLVRKPLHSFPLWSSKLYSSPHIPIRNPAEADILYFPACITRMMGGDANKPGSQLDALLQLSVKAGLKIRLPEEIKGICCGQAFLSKGYRVAYKKTVEKAVRTLWELSASGRLPIVMDVTSCTYTLLQCRADLSDECRMLFDQLTLLDSIDYVHDFLLPKLVVRDKKGKIVLHPVCTLSKHESWLPKLKAIGAACAVECIIPVNAGCCGMAGDRGFYYPGLIKAAAAREAAEVKNSRYDGYYSTGKTCEISMSEAVGEDYRSILYLLNETT